MSYTKIQKQVFQTALANMSEYTGSIDGELGDLSKKAIANVLAKISGTVNIPTPIKPESPVIVPDVNYTPFKGTPGKGRKLAAGSVDLFMAKLEKAPAFLDAVKKRDPRAIVTLAGESQVGVREKGGNNKGKEVVIYQNVIGGAAAEAWCMSFVQSCIAFAEYVTGIQSPLHASEHCMTVWNNTDVKQRVSIHPLRGAVIIWRHGTSTSGHTGILESADESSFSAFEGNTEGGLSESGAVVRDGGGVYHTKRNIKGTGNMKVVGFLKPF